jgi:uncharacterized protein YjeT (DUF2065 family)
VLAWSDFAAAVALFLVIEGIAPFVGPARWKAAITRLLEIPDGSLRLAGLGSIVVGLLLLVVVRT